MKDNKIASSLRENLDEKNTFRLFVAGDIVWCRLFQFIYASLLCLHVMLSGGVYGIAVVLIIAFSDMRSVINRMAYMLDSILMYPVYRLFNWFATNGI